MIRGYRGPKKPSINQPRIGNILDPLGNGRKWTNVWGAVMNVPQPSGEPITPTPTPTPGLSPTPTPTATITPTPTPSSTPTTPQLFEPLLIAPDTYLQVGLNEYLEYT